MFIYVINTFRFTLTFKKNKKYYLLTINFHHLFLIISKLISFKLVVNKVICGINLFSSSFFMFIMKIFYLIIFKKIRTF